MALSAASALNTLKEGSQFSPEGQVAGSVYRLGKKMALGSGALFGAVALYFMRLGAAALKGFIVGAAVGGVGGGTAGAILGAQVGAAIGTVVIPIPVVGTLAGGAVGGLIGGTTGFFIGGAVGGIAGGLIAYGFASGSATAVSTGIGTGVGGTVGGIAGGYVGSAIGVSLATGFVSLAVAACAATLLGCVLVPIATVSAPIIVATSTALGAAGGALVGAFVGGAIGYGFGRYVLHPAAHYASGFSSGFATGASKGWHYTISSIKGSGTAAGGGISSAASLGGGFSSSLATAGSTFLSAATGAASAVWGGLTTAAGTVLGGIASTAGSLWGALTGGISVSATTVAGIVGVSATTVVAAGIITQTNIATSFMSNQVDKPSKPQIPGENQYISIVKTADKTNISNSDLPTDINYTVTLTVHSSDLTNVSCTDTTNLIKTDGSQAPLTTDLVGPICPSNLSANQVLNFNFKTHLDSTSDFQNASVENTFTANFDAAGGNTGGSPPPPPTGGSPCTATDGFGAQFLPNSIPPSVNSYILANNLHPPQEVVNAASAASAQTGVPCEMMVGMDFVEAGWDRNSSFVTGATLGSPEGNSIDPALCTATGGTVSGSSCIFDDINSSALFQAKFITWKMQILTGSVRPPANFDEMIGTMSLYNGGGNSNCGTGVPYNGPCPPPRGIDDPYAIAHFDPQHANMYLIYCAPYTVCSPPKSFTRDGAATAAKEFYLSIGGK